MQYHMYIRRSNNGIFSKIKDAFVKNKDKDKYLSGLSRSKKSFGDRLRALSNNFHGIDDELLEEIMILLLESDVGIHTAQKIVDEFESNGKNIKNYDSMEDYLISILYDFYDVDSDQPINYNEEGPIVILMVGVNGSGKRRPAQSSSNTTRSREKQLRWQPPIHSGQARSIRSPNGPNALMCTV